VFAEDDEDRAAMRLNALLERAGAVPQLVADGDSWVLRHTPGAAGPSARLIAEASAVLAEAVSGLGWERLGVCGAAPCTCVFVDRSRSGTRRYCCRLCADRAATAAYRARRRGDVV
jgi:predicted RNA-binding Zn ribbon-like protein